MDILINFEFSGRVRDAFIRKGHNAVSCDLRDSESNFGPHLKMDYMEAIHSQHWDMMIAHPPCTDLATSGARWFPEKIADGRQARALQVVQNCFDADIEKIAVENPRSVISRIRKRDQEIHPWMHGEPYQKATWLWLKNLKLLYPSQIVSGRIQEVWLETPGPDREKNRSRTYQGIADAMAEQWG